FVEQGVRDVDRGRFTRIVGVFFESPAVESNALPRYRVVQGTHNHFRKAAFLVVVHDDDLLPIVRHLGQSVGTGNVHQVEDVFLEAGSAKSDRGFEELGADTAIRTNGAGHFIHVRTRHLAKFGYGVDGRDTLGQK